MAFLRWNSFGTVGHHQDVTWLSFTDTSPFIAVVDHSFQGTKNPAYFAVSRVGENPYSLPAYSESIQITFRLLPNRRQG